MTGFFIAIGFLVAVYLYIGYANIRYGNPLAESDRKLMEQGKLPDLM